MNLFKLISSLILFSFLSGPIFGETQPVEVKEESSTKRQADKGYYLGLGPIGLWNLNSAGLGYYVTTGYAFDVDQLTMKLGGEFFGRSGALGLVGSIGISYMPTGIQLTDVNPFLGLDFGYGTARVNDYGGWVAAFVLGPQAGVQLFRTANVNLELALKWGFFMSAGQFGSPSYSLFRVSLYFM
jgi:hypothetical protein